ncbi:ricin B-like lectin EULS3 isoform X1 [Rhodamnia argentea]|uniref:Ricin B-like lectin EULS3 isoform X1 n=1 Tax=Rhodamnia argentea TaxID=178133 RepID=A0A8B8NBG9_9MYRT|nr:ricin B-like lectin EULS3 isoform X1 [Rhodamnia argentea]
MEFPFGHHTHGHHRRDGDDDDEESPRNRPYPPPGSTLPPDFDGQPPPPRPPFYGGCGDDFAPPPPPPFDVYHTSYSTPPSGYPPPQDRFDSGYSSDFPPPPQSFSQESTEYSDYPPPPPPPSATVQQVADEVDEPSETHHSHRPHMPAFLHHHTLHQSDSGPAAAASGGGALGSYFANRPTYKVYCKAEPNYSLTIRDSKVILASSDSSDPYQKWYKDEKFSTRVKDEEGFPCFSLVNKATGEAIKHSVGASHPVQLVPYKPEQLDESVLWSEGKDLGDGYRTVRMVNNVRLNLDAFHGDKKSGGVHDGTTIVLSHWNKGDTERWKITPY